MSKTNGQQNGQSDSQKLKASFEKSVDIFEKVLDGDKVTPEQLQVALTASNLYTKAKATENQKALLIYQVARDYSKDKEELRSILQTSIPNIKFLPNTTGRD